MKTELAFLFAVSRSAARAAGVIFLSVSAFHFAHAEIVFNRVNNRIVAVGADCGEVTSELPNLKTWLNGTNPEKQCQYFATSSQSGGGCSFDVTGCLPDHPVKYHGTNPKISGPNCWNLALVMKGLVPALRYTSPNEMSYFMNSPLCKEVPANQPRQAGDVGAIRSKGPYGKDEVHGFIYVSDKLAYSKNGFSRESPYALQSVDNVYKVYGVRPDAPYAPSNNANSKSMASSGEGQMNVQVYRCRSAKDYLKQKGAMPPAMAAVLFHAERVERCASSTAFTGKPTTTIEVANLVSSTKALIKYLEAAKTKNEMLDEKSQVALGSLNVRLDAISEQLSMAGTADIAGELNKNSSFVLSGLSDEIRRGVESGFAGNKNPYQ